MAGALEMTPAASSIDEKEPDPPQIEASEADP
jgi:hypothetical protein